MPTSTSPARSARPSSDADDHNAVSRFRERVRRMPGGFVAWRVTVSILGVAIIIGGIILLPLPGPGWLVIFAGLGVLATEYEWAGRLLRFARDQVKRWTSWLGRQPLWVRGVVGLGCVVIVVGAAWAVWAISR